MAENSEVFLSVILDENARKKAENGLDSIAQKMGNVGKTATEIGHAQGIETFTEKQAKLAQKNAQYIKEAKEKEAELRREMAAVSRIAGITVEQVRDLPENIYQAGIAAAQLEKNFSRSLREMRTFMYASRGLRQIFQPLQVAGTAVIAAIALSARNYSKFIEDAGIQGDRTSEKWIAASKRVKNAQLNLGETAAQVLLPIYEQLAEYAEKATRFAQEHPDILKAGINIAAVVATVGTLGVLAAKGIQLYADFKFLAAMAQYEIATTRFEASVQQFLAGSLIGGPASIATKAGTAGLLGTAGKTLGTVALYASAVIIGAEAGVAIGNALGKVVYGEGYKKQGLADVALTATRVPLTGLVLLSNKLKEFTQYGGPAGKLGVAISEAIQKEDQWVQNILGLTKAQEDAAKAAADYRDFEAEATRAQATKAFISYRQQEADAEKQYGQARADIVKQGLAQINSIEESYQTQRALLIRNNAQSVANALASFQFSQQQAAEQFAHQEAQAQRKYQDDRKKLAEDERQAEQKAVEDNLRKIRKLQEEHDDKIRDLTAARDALGIVRENRDFQRKLRDAEEEYRTERLRRRQQTVERIKDLDEQFRRERQKRQEDFAFRQQQAEEQFKFQQEQAKAQFEQRLKDLDEQHRVELEKARQQQAERLRELQIQYRQEQITRRNAFYDILRDLDASLLNEEKTRLQYYARMQQDLEKFLSDTANSVTSAGSNLPGYETHQAGGYGPGRVGRGEYVLNRSTTSALEKMIGGRLTQQGVQSTFSSNAITVNLAFPGGLITKKQMLDALDANTRHLLTQLTKGIPA